MYVMIAVNRIVKPTTLSISPNVVIVEGKFVVKA
jgi:hypothetical protein